MLAGILGHRIPSSFTKEGAVMRTLATRIASTIVCSCCAVSSLAGCAEPLEAPSAYSQERYLCGASSKAEFDAWAEDCRQDYLADGSCLGVASMQGTVDGDPFVIDSRLSASYTTDAADPFSLGLINARGASPYSFFYISITSLERLDERSEFCRTAASLFGLEVRGASFTRRAIIDKCSFEPRAEGWYVAFTSGLSGGGYLDACLYLLPESASR
jgi:hypothetical protein